jgi:hypothetical protein
MGKPSIAVSVGALSLSMFLATPANAGQCRDPWITAAIREVTGREPNGSAETGECTYTQYGGGRWGSYQELVGYVRAKLGSTTRIPSEFLGGNFARPSQPTPVNMAQIRVNRNAVAGWRNGNTEFLYNGKWYKLVGNDGASLIGNDSGGLISNMPAPR